MRHWLTKAAEVLNLRTFAPLGGQWWGRQHTAQFPAAETGRAVTPEAAMTLSAFWSCVRLLSQTIATLPLFVYRRDAEGQKALARDLRLFEIMHDQPNADMTAVEFWEGCIAALCLYGNAYAEISRNLGGEVVALTPLRPDHVTVYREDDGSLGYRVTSVAGSRVLTEREVFHVKGFGVDGMVGLSPVAYARQSLGLALAAQTSAGKTFANGMRPSGVLTGGALKADQRERLREIMAGFGGPENAGKTLLLEGDFKYAPLTLSPADAQLMQTLAWSVEDVCRWLGVPPVLIGHTDKASSWASSLEQTNLHFLQYGLRPYLTRIEQAIRRCVLSPAERRALHAEFAIEGLLRADAAGRAGLFKTYITHSIATPNEIRQLENLPRSDDPNADRLQAQANMTTLERLGAMPTEPVPVISEQP